jgi:hypothetical protein
MSICSACLKVTSYHISIADSISSPIHACSSANLWADETLAKYQADHAIFKNASTSDFLSSAGTVRDQRAITAGRECGVTALQVFDKRWNNAGGSLYQAGSVSNGSKGDKDEGCLQNQGRQNVSCSE